VTLTTRVTDWYITGLMRRYRKARERLGVPDGEMAPLELMSMVRQIERVHEFRHWLKYDHRTRVKRFLFGHLRCGLCGARVKKDFRRFGWMCFEGHFISYEAFHRNPRVIWNVWNP
jgi:hypothetical protein